ncbi:hypothetical protein CLOP_g8822, partial [Closterium sp. NIES-67]
YAYERYHGDACPFYLVRPDGHVAMRADHWQPGRAQAYFDGIRGSCGKAGVGRGVAWMRATGWVFGAVGWAGHG